MNLCGLLMNRTGHRSFIGFQLACIYFVLLRLLESAESLFKLQHGTNQRHHARIMLCEGG